ncbi:hypothetical protein SAMN04488103_103318 [Gemmobacter aquatilis]|uniref:Uncharacterized protein n=1 Tax=Gemmobacter aquatilis TaxID=933059 RepID=A0A1H8EH02_9RHOB|nr:hypothetical protein [Gemmobacter aquatilis]SEN18742.1 hypothetical protein SAMN04488103_103318 [Gemmobacter aquatilis]
MVHPHGAIKGGVETAETTITTLPAGFRPPAEIIIPVCTLASPYIAQLRVTAAGVMSLRTAGDATGMFLDGCSWIASI